jgi:hypothetical protein
MSGVTASRAGWLAWTAATAVIVALAAMLTAGVVAARYEAQLTRIARETAAARDRLHREEAALTQQMGAYREAIELLREPATRVVVLRATASAAPATARLIWNERLGGQLLVADLPRPTAGQAYELWILGESLPRPAGVFGVDAGGRGAARVPAVAGAKGFMVTVEPAAGSAAPTGPTVLASR